MNKLEKKFYELAGGLDITNKIPTHIDFRGFLKQLAEIAEEYYVNCDKCMKLCGENTELKKQIECEIANNSLTLERLAITEEEYEEEIKELKKKIDIMKDIIKALEYDVKFWKDKSRGLAIPITKDEIEKEFKNYNGAQHDDAVDALSFAIQTLHRKRTLWRKIKLWFRKLKNWFRKKILKVEYAYGIDMAKGNDYSCKVTIRRNLITGQITIIKIEYF